jgi:hypothetical protein
VGSFARKVTTASGATAVQIVHKRGRLAAGIDHIGSAHTDEELALLLAQAGDRLHAGQGALDMELAGEPGPPRAVTVAMTSATVTSTAPLVLWQTLVSAYRRLGFGDIISAARRSRRWCSSGSSSRPAKSITSGG